MELFVYNDCWQLLQRFGRAADESQNASFELFSQCWLEMQMQHIYSAQTNHIEVMETTLAALHVAKRAACGRRTNGEISQTTRSQRIGGIYLMYAIFNKQPTKHFVKIEVSPCTWDSLCNYLTELRHENAERWDTQQVSYIFWKLVQGDAFLYTALDYCLALDALAAYDNLESIAAASKQKSNSVDILKQQLRPSAANFNEELHGLEDLAEISKPLCQLQDAYNKQMIPHRSSFSATTIFSQLQDVFQEINNIVTKEEKPSTSTIEVHDQLDSRKRVRHKAMFGEANTAISTEQKSEQPLFKSSSSHERRMSSATVFERRLPDDVARDLQP